ncbi:MAG: hypothetical protein ACPF9D_10865, partial [Owenweeksia sp.]
IQVWKSVRVIKKPDYTTESRKVADKEVVKAKSRACDLEDEVLFLPFNTEPAPDLISTDLMIVINDDGPGQTINRKLVCFQRPVVPRTFDIFKIGRNQSGGFDLHLEYSAHKFHIGIPERSDHKIAELKPGQVVRYRINGKSDFTLTSRKQRTFMEYDYFFEYSGKARKIGFRELHTFQGTITPVRIKLVDERKILK